MSSTVCAGRHGQFVVDRVRGAQVANLNEDPQLTGRLIYSFAAGEHWFGRREGNWEPTVPARLLRTGSL